MAPAAENAPTRPLVQLVEDDLPLGRALKFALEVAGYRVDLMDSAEALLDRELPDEPVCIVTDLHLPGRQGIEALEILRRRGVLSPAILMTTQPTPDVHLRAKRAGVVVLEKPILGDHLLEVIRNLSAD